MPTALSAWVSTTAERLAHEAVLRQSLTGRRIVGVRYVELEYENASGPMWPASGFDSLDFGLELDLDNGQTWSCVWRQYGHNEGVCVYELPLVPEALIPSDDRAVWDLTDRWHDLGGRYYYNHCNIAVFFSIADAQAAGVWLEPETLG